MAGAFFEAELSFSFLLVCVSHCLGTRKFQTSARNFVPLVSRTKTIFDEMLLAEPNEEEDPPNEDFGDSKIYSPPNSPLFDSPWRDTNEHALAIRQRSSGSGSSSDGSSSAIVEIGKEEKHDQPQPTEDIDEEDLVTILKQGETTGSIALSNLGRTKVPKEIWKLTNLTSLNLSANSLKTIPKEIGSLTGLKKIHLNHNEITVLPNSLWTLSKLTNLYLNNNKLKSLPINIKQLSCLKILDVSANQLTEIPPQINGLVALVELRARNNKIETVPKTLGKLANLKVLSLEGNPLVFPPKAVVKKGLSAILAFLNDDKNVFKQPTAPVHDLRNPLPSQKDVSKKSASSKRKKQFLMLPPETKKPRKSPSIEAERVKVKSLEEQLKLATEEKELMKRNFEQEKERLVQMSHSHPKADDKEAAQTPSTTPQSINGYAWEIPPSELQLGRLLGRGSYGEVWRGLWRNTPCAVKKLYTDHMNEKSMRSLRAEIDLLCRLRHPNVVLFMGACIATTEACIVMEYLSRGSLASILSNQDIELDYTLRMEMLIDSARGVNYLHNFKPPIIHRDLKTDNLLVDDNWQVKVADFGLAKTLHTYAKTNCGTIGYVAPEVLHNKPYSEKADVYSFGVVLWELLTREIPYHGQNTIAVIHSIDKGETLQIPEDCHPEYRNLMTRCWNVEPHERPSFQEILAELERLLDTVTHEEEEEEVNESSKMEEDSNESTKLEVTGEVIENNLHAKNDIDKSELQ